MRLFQLLLVLFAATAVTTTEAAPLEQRNIIAFTTEPNDLGSAANFFVRYPFERCEQFLLDTNFLLYFCQSGDVVQKFYFNVGYNENTLVLDGVSLNGEPPNLAESLLLLQQELVPELLTRFLATPMNGKKSSDGIGMRVLGERPMKTVPTPAISI